jgi:hypothetical protein
MNFISFLFHYLFVLIDMIRVFLLRRKCVYFVLKVDLLNMNIAGLSIFTVSAYIYLGVEINFYRLALMI